MKQNLKILVLSVIIFFGAFSVTFCQRTQNMYKADLVIDNNLYLTTFLSLQRDGNQVHLTSPKNADVRLFGGMKARVGRLVKKSPKKGIVVTLNGEQQGDALIGSMTIAYIGKFDFKGTLKGDSLQGDFSKGDTLIGTFSGQLSLENRLDQRNLCDAIVDTTRHYIYSKDMLARKEWIAFEKGLKKMGAKAKDDLELLLFTFTNTSKLPFSHLFLIPNPNLMNEEEEGFNQDEVVFIEKNATTAYLKIDNFSSTSEALDSILPRIVGNKNYTNLIIDLRDNGGGGIEAANVFSRYLIHGKVNVGYFVAQKFVYEKDTLKSFEKLPEIIPSSTQEFVESMKITEGAKYVIDNSTKNEIFEGKIYILVNKSTASTCEPIVYLMKSNVLATVIGENTAGAMLSASYFQLDHKFHLILPVADYFTPDLKRLDQIGVKPDVETTSENALDKALELIKFGNTN